MNSYNAILAYSTFASQKLPASDKGYSLLESLVALFILALISGVAIKHQGLLLQTQAESQAQSLAKRQAHQARLLGHP